MACVNRGQGLDGANALRRLTNFLDSRFLITSFATFGGSGGLWRARLVVMMIADDSQNPAADELAIDRLCFPRTVGLLGRRLVLGGLASVGAAAALANEVGADNGGARSTAVGARLDDFVAFLFCARVEIAHEVLARCVQAGVRHGNGLKDSEHGCAVEVVPKELGGACLCVRVCTVMACGWLCVFLLGR